MAISPFHQGRRLAAGLFALIKVVSRRPENSALLYNLYDPSRGSSKKHANPLRGLGGFAFPWNIIPTGRPEPELS